MWTATIFWCIMYSDIFYIEAVRGDYVWPTQIARRPPYSILNNLNVLEMDQ